MKRYPSLTRYTHVYTNARTHTHTLHVNLHRYDMHYCPSQTKLHTTMPPMPNKPSTRYSLVVPGITSAARPESWSSPAAARPLANPSPHSAGSVGHLGTGGELSAAVSHRFTAGDLHRPRMYQRFYVKRLWIFGTAASHATWDHLLKQITNTSRLWAFQPTFRSGLSRAPHKQILPWPSNWQ